MARAIGLVCTQLCESDLKWLADVSAEALNCVALLLACVALDDRNLAEASIAIIVRHNELPIADRDPR